MEIYFTIKTVQNIFTRLIHTVKGTLEDYNILSYNRYFNDKYNEFIQNVNIWQNQFNNDSETFPATTPNDSKNKEEMKIYITQYKLDLKIHEDMFKKIGELYDVYSSNNSKTESIDNVNVHNFIHYVKKINTIYTNLIQKCTPGALKVNIY